MPKGIGFTSSPSNPFPTGYVGIWAQDAGGGNAKLMITKPDGGTIPIQAIVESQASQYQQFTRNMQNLTGATIPAGAAVYISGPGQIDLCNASDINAYKFFGITAAAIPNASTGSVVYLGSIQGIFTGLGIPAGSYIWISDTPGAMSVTPASGVSSVDVVIGLSDGDDLILQPQVRGDLK